MGNRLGRDLVLFAIVGLAMPCGCHTAAVEPPGRSAASSDGSPKAESLSFRPGSRFEPEEELASSLGGNVRSVYITETDGSNSRVIVSFESRGTSGQHGSLNDFAAGVDGAFRGAYPDRVLSILAIEGTELLEDAGYPFVALAYGHNADPRGGKPSSICDAAALLIETPEGFWTISWNATRGTLGESRDVLKDFLGGMSTTRQ